MMHQMAAKYGISSIPSLKFFKNGEVYDEKVGFASKEAIVDKLG